jgi:two-component system chemotaxis sensor kinase CheA
VALSVLVVDDSIVTCKVVADTLSGAGYTVTVAHDGFEALRALETLDPDLIVTDVEMPHMGGAALLEELRRRGKQMPVVMMTTRLSSENAGQDSGANAYLLKANFDASALLETVKRLLNQ